MVEVICKLWEPWPILSHETGYPSRKKIAQTLRAMTAEPNHLLLAAELFQMSGYYRESLELLTDLYDRGECSWMSLKKICV